MEYIFGKRPVPATETGVNQKFNSVDAHLLPPANSGTRQPCGATLKMFARLVAGSYAGKMMGHPLTKAVAGPLFLLGTKIDCLGLDHDWLGEYATLVAGCGIAMFVVSTAISICNRPRYEPLVKHLAQSAGYFVAGGPLAILQLITWLRCRDSLQEFDPEQIRQQIAQDWDPVLDGPADPWDSPADVELGSQQQSDQKRVTIWSSKKSQRSQEDVPA